MRGLKSLAICLDMVIKNVAPYTGAWIEIVIIILFRPVALVAPYTGAWIEINPFEISSFQLSSHPTRVRGLKFLSNVFLRSTFSRTLHGCVD